MELTPSLPPGRYVDLPGRGRTWVYDSASAPVTDGSRETAGPAVLLLHGWTSSAALNWQSCFAPLARHYRLVAPDHRGHGRGLRSHRPFTLEDCADDTAALIQELKLGKAIVVGYSMGGPVALWTWRRHPEAVRGLVLCATAATFGAMPKWSGRRGDLVQALSVALGYTPVRLRTKVMGHLARRWAEDGTAAWAIEEWARHDPVALMQSGMALSRYDVTGWIGDIDVPAAIVVTGRDTTVPPRRQWALAKGVPGALTFPVAGAHRACVEQADEFVPVLLSALAALEAPEESGPGIATGAGDQLSPADRPDSVDVADGNL